MKVFGAKPSEIEAVLAARAPEVLAPFELWEENLESFRMFCRLKTQWHVAAGLSVQRIGLSYPAAIALMRERGMKREARLEMLDDLRAMEGGALEAWAEEDTSS